jgi:hypothetical protein
MKAGRNVCIPEGCPFTYTLRLTNPMDRDAQVKSCVMADNVEVWLNSVSGVYLKAGATRKGDGWSYVPLPKDAAKGLAGSPVTCDGLDWHGNPPI